MDLNSEALAGVSSPEDILFLDPEITTKRLCHIALVDGRGRMVLNAIVKYEETAEQILEEQAQTSFIPSMQNE